MSKVLRSVGRVASVVLPIAGAIIGGPLGATIGSAIAASINVAADITAKKPSSNRQGSQLSFKIDPGAPIPYVVGRTAVGGTIVQRGTFGKDNHYQTFFAVLGGGGPYGLIEDQLVDRAVVSFSGTAATGYYGGWMWSDKQVGLTPEPDALTDGVTGSPYGYSGSVPGWGAAHRLSGYCAASWTLLFDTKARRYAQGEPAPAWIVRGARVYDPRLDSTYPGGSGPCRWAPPSDPAAHTAARATWVYSETPALHSLMWKLGVWQRNEANPAAKSRKLMGVGAPIDLIDVAAHVASANVQEMNGWKVGGELNSAMGRWEAVKLIEQAGGAEPVANGALLSTMQLAARVSLATITAADLADGRLSVPGGRSRRERINGFRARFRSEAHGWEMVPIDLVQIADYVEADGGERTDSDDFALVQDANQAAQLGAYRIYDSREILPIVLPLKPKWMGYRIGDGLTLNLPEHGLIAQPVIVRARSIDPGTGVVTMTFATETPGKHAEAIGRTGIAPPIPTLTTESDEVAAPIPGAWTLTGTTFTDNGVSIPALVITGALDNVNAQAIVLEYRPAGVGAEWAGASAEPPELTRKEITSVTPGTSYEASIRYRVRGVTGARLVLGPVTAGTLEVPGSVGPPGPAGVSVPQPIKVTTVGANLAVILVQAGQTITLSASVGIGSNGNAGQAKVSLRVAVNDGAYVEIGSAIDNVAVGEPVLIEASASYANATSGPVFVAGRLAVTGPTGVFIRTDTTNFFRAT